jgi:hypothetical protein
MDANNCRLWAKLHKNNENLAIKCRSNAGLKHALHRLHAALFGCKTPRHKAYRTIDKPVESEPKESSCAYVEMLDEGKLLSNNR